MNKYIFCLLFILIGVLIYFAPFGFAHVCAPVGSGKFMKCHWLGEAVCAVGAIVAVQGVVFGLAKAARCGIAVSNICVSAALVWLVLEGVGTCKSPLMPCNLYTKPVILVLAGVLLAVSGLYLIMRRKAV